MILPGLTLVVSPLLSLMVDQLRKLSAFLPGGLLASNQVNNMHTYLFFYGNPSHPYSYHCSTLSNSLRQAMSFMRHYKGCVEGK